MVDLCVKTGTRLPLRDKRLFEISEFEITRVDCTCCVDLIAFFLFVVLLLFVVGSVVYFDYLVVEEETGCFAFFNVCTVFCYLFTISNGVIARLCLVFSWTTIFQSES